MGNFIKTFLLIGILTFILAVAGYYFRGTYGMAIMLMFVILFNLGSYWFSDKIILMMYKATEVDPVTMPRLHGIVDELSRNAGIPKPRIYITPHKAPNAFATGRSPSNGVVAVTRGLLELLNENELRGVIAHELAHIKHYDMLIHMIAATLAGMISSIAYVARWGLIFAGGRRRGIGTIIGWLLLTILAPVAAMLIQLAISRSREYAADDGSSKITRNPLYLASALEKLGGFSQNDLGQARNTAHFFITSPLKSNFIGNLFRTHPPIEERVRRLRGKI
ncbi:MAG TPA: protease HtpX [Firmicutes bacterium]|nr:protease HtpX [Bacillota bacterium]